MQRDQRAEMLTKKREQYLKNVLGHDISVLRCGYIDIAKGAVLTQEAALKAAESHAQNESHRRSVAAITNERRILNKEKRRAVEMLTITKLKSAQCNRRANTFGLEVAKYKQFVRTIGERRAVARLRTKLRNCPPIPT